MQMASLHSRSYITRILMNSLLSLPVQEDRHSGISVCESLVKLHLCHFMGILGKSWKTHTRKKTLVLTCQISALIWHVEIQKYCALKNS